MPPLITIVEPPSDEQLLSILRRAVSCVWRWYPWLEFDELVNECFLNFHKNRQTSPAQIEKKAKWHALATAFRLMGLVRNREGYTREYYLFSEPHPNRIGSIQEAEAHFRYPHPPSVGTIIVTKSTNNNGSWNKKGTWTQRKGKPHA